MSNNLMEKLLISKQIMDKHNEIPRSGAAGSFDSNQTIRETIASPELYSPEPIQASYNIPEEYTASQITQKPKQFVNTEDKIINSKLPDAIKKLMLENPIQQPQMTGPSISDELVEKASRLMNANKNQTQTKQVQTESRTQSNPDMRKMMKEVMEEILRENGIIAESESKSQETFQFKVGKHIFEGRITKVKKIS
jgi:hypothetical protein